MSSSANHEAWDEDKESLNTLKKLFYAKQFKSLPEASKQLWRKTNGSIFMFIVEQIIKEKMACKVKERLQALRDLLRPDEEIDPAERDLKNRRIEMAKWGNNDQHQQVIQELCRYRESNVFGYVQEGILRNTNAAAFFNYYFATATYACSQIEIDMILQGRRQADIEQEKERVAAYWKLPHAQFVVKIAMAPCGKLTPKLKLGTALSKLFNLTFMKYGNNHAALQVGPYLIHWFNDSIVHINVVSLKKALLLIYPRYDTADCFTNRADVLAGSSLESTYFGKIAIRCVEWNLKKTYNALHANCQHFWTKLLADDLHFDIEWKVDGVISRSFPFWLRLIKETGKYVNAIMDQTVTLANPYHFWTIEDKIVSRKNLFGRVSESLEKVYVKVELEDHLQFLEWCQKNNVPKILVNDAPIEMKELFHLCLSIDRAARLRLKSAHKQNLDTEYFILNGTKNYTGITMEK